MMKTNRPNQSDLFEAYPGEGDLFSDQQVAEIPTADYVRDHMQKILSEVRGASRLPWTPDTARVYETIFPQMSKWLAPSEARALVEDFMSELSRLKTEGGYQEG